MPIFVCRWPNGDLSIVEANDKDDAICRLDEIDNAETSHVFRVDNLLLDLKLADDGRLTTDDEHRFGEVSEGEIMEEAYPILWEARGHVAAGKDKDRGGTIKKAVQQERERIVPAPVSVPIDPKLRAIKKMTGMPDALLRKLKKPPAGPKRKV